MNNNKLKQIQFNNLIQLQNLQLENNKFDSILKVKSLNLRILNLKSNKITKIEANSFNGLLKLKLINLLNNSINEIDLNGFRNTNFKEIRLSIQNITIKMIHLLKDKLKPNFVYNHWIYNYYDSIYIENRQDIDCFKMLFLIKYKIFYNFIFDYHDINDITSNCMNLSKVRDTLNRFNDNVYHINYKPIEMQPIDHLTYQLVTWIIFCIILFIIAFTCIQCFFIKKNNKINIIYKSITNKIELESNKQIVIVYSNLNTIIEQLLESETELINNLDEIINLDQLYKNKMINKLKIELENLKNLNTTTQCLYINLIKKLFDHNELACNNSKTLIQKYSFLIESRGIHFKIEI